MNIKLPILTKKIFDLGSYSKPVLNYLLDNKIDVCYKNYLKSLENIWNREYEKALKEVNCGLKKCKENKSLYYLLLSNKFIILFYLKDTVNFKILYNKIRKEYKKIPPSVRKITNQFLINYSFMNEDLNLPKSRFWSKDKEISPSTKLFLLIGKARKEIKEGRIEKGVSYYQKGLQIAAKIPHPSGIITCYNDISWYLINEKPFKSLYYAEKGIYYLSYYFEDPKIYFYILDTIFNIEKKLNYYKIFETSEIIDIYKDDDFVKSKYSNLLNEIKKFDVNFNKNLYKNSLKLRNYLKKQIKNINKTSKLTKISRNKLNNILNGKTKNIRGDTIRKLINGLNIDIDNNIPNEIFSEIIKIRIDQNFKNSVEYLKEKSKIERNKLIVSTYMALFNRRNLYKYLIKKDVLKRIIYLIDNDFDIFINFTQKKYETKRFISYILNPPTFIKGRRNLISKFLDNIDKAKLNFIINFYLNIKENEREILDIFIRNYIRFDKISHSLGINSDIRFKHNDIIESLNLNSNSCILSYSSFSKWERVKFNRFLEKFAIAYKDNKIE
ncbi:MAG TPA: helix-turn-helix transcriptional regulator [Caldisericia bacterium]|nr:helix-turn-helix transcriptional regulator [Caldisericia bacterium]